LKNAKRAISLQQFVRSSQTRGNAERICEVIGCKNFISNSKITDSRHLEYIDKLQYLMMMQNGSLKNENYQLFGGIARKFRGVLFWPHPVEDTVFCHCEAVCFRRENQEALAEERVCVSCES